MTVARLLREMPADEFAQWKALYTIERGDQQQPAAEVVSLADFKQRMGQREAEYRQELKRRGRG